MRIKWKQIELEEHFHVWDTGEGTLTGGYFGSDYAQAIGEADPDGKGSMLLRNSSDATVSVNQWAPAIYQAGQAWDTDGAESQEVRFRQVMEPKDGTTVSGKLWWDFSINGGGYSTAMSLTSAGLLTTNSFNAATGNITCATGNIVSTTGYIQAGSVITLHPNVDAGYGLGTADNIYNTSRELTIASSRTEAASNRVVTICYDLDSGTFTEEATMRLLSVGWYNGASYQEEFYVRGDGNIIASAGVSAATGIYTAQGSLNVGNATYIYIGTGHGVDSTTGEIWASATTSRPGVLRGLRTDADGNTVWATTYDVGTASITWADTIRIMAFGYTDNVDAFHELLAVRGDADLMWGTDGTGNIGAAASGRPDAIYAKSSITSGGTITGTTYVTSSAFISATTYMNGLTYVKAGTSGNGILISANPAAVGVTGRQLFTENVAHTLQIRGVYASGSGNISIALDADVAASSINAAHKVFSAAWINDSDVRDELMYLAGNGDLYVDGTIYSGGSPVGSGDAANDLNHNLHHQVFN